MTHYEAVALRDSYSYFENKEFVTKELKFKVCFLEVEVTPESNWKYRVIAWIDTLDDKGFQKVTLNMILEAIKES